jgi:osmotically-inducible protein OsmY
MEYHRQGLRHLIERALKRNTFTASQRIRVVVRGENVWLVGSVSHADLIAEAVATVESVAPFINVYSRLRIRRVSSSPAW